uniref:Uncharacterized protein n=1 Tax=Caenorhabditis japonica TaxID=281687 RepID=A0A8R1IVU1_CAEJA
MTAEVMEITRRNFGELDQKERRVLFRRSQSEPVNFGSEGVSMTSRTEPEWHLTVDSISLQSSFVDYQYRRKERLRKQKELKKSEVCW